MKMLIGFFFGLMVASALAQQPPYNLITSGAEPIGATLNAGVGPNGKMAPILVDGNGYVICSSEKTR